MLKVAIFFDGKNFYTSWRERANGRRLSFGGLTRWLANTAAGLRPALLTGAHYYTGVERDEADEGTRKLHRFLDHLEVEPGFFVTRLFRRDNNFHCNHCGTVNAFTQEREVDTTMTADMIRLAATGAFDVMVLVSGDTDHVPALDAVRALGKIAYVASWGGNGLAPRLRRAAFDTIDMMAGLPSFEIKEEGSGEEPVGEHTPSEPPPRVEGAINAGPIIGTGSRATAEEQDEVFLSNLRAAVRAFEPGYVGVNYFVTRWRGVGFDASPPERRQSLDRLVLAEKVEIYDVNGNKALRLR